MYWDHLYLSAQKVLFARACVSSPCWRPFPEQNDRESSFSAVELCCLRRVKTQLRTLFQTWTWIHWLCHSLYQNSVAVIGKNPSVFTNADSCSFSSCSFKYFWKSVRSENLKRTQASWAMSLIILSTSKHRCCVLDSRALNVHFW